jgi:hypothetical protein
MPKTNKKGDKAEEKVKEKETSENTNPWEQPISGQPNSSQQKEGDETNGTPKPAAKPAPLSKNLKIK